MVGRIAGQRCALWWQKARRRHRHRWPYLLQAGWPDDREGYSIRERWRQCECCHDPGSGPRDRPRKGQGWRVHQLAEPTGPMRTEAIKAGFYETEFGIFPKIPDPDDCRAVRWEAASVTVARRGGVKEGGSRGCERWQANKAAALGNTSVSDALMLVAWISAVFALGFAAGWFAGRRSSKRRGRRRLDLR
jgi:hypothetical protein